MPVTVPVTMPVTVPLTTPVTMPVTAPVTMPVTAPVTVVASQSGQENEHRALTPGLKKTEWL
jgi:hypothetical protein